MLRSEMGQANWPNRPPALTAKAEKAIPLARPSNDNTSTGYRACSGVRPTEYVAPKIKMQATVALAAAALVSPDSLKVPVAAVTPIQTMQQPVIENNMSGRRPMRSTHAAPNKAKANWKQLYPRLMLACSTPSVYPAVSSTAGKKYAG